jgi:uncharacterized DUF497 family protein
LAINFVWDELKAQGNQNKHGVSFLEATEVFADELSSCIDDPDHSYGEARYLLFGISSKGNPLVVSFTERLETIELFQHGR